MLQINLLDWREKRRYIQNNRFYAISGLIAAICMLLIFMISSSIDVSIEESKNNVSYLESEIKLVQQKIQQIKDLEKQKELLLARREVVETLQASRTFVIKIFDNLSRVVPAEVILNEMTRKGEQLSIAGTGNSNSAVATLIKNVQRLRWVKDAQLTELKNSDDRSSGKKTESSSKKSGDKASSENSVDEGKVDFKMEITINSGMETK